MHIHKTKILTRYGETDCMGIIYHTNYINYYEIARTAMLKDLGCYSYKEMEEEGVMMPVIDVQSTFMKPAYYDQELTVCTRVESMPTSKIVFLYEIYNPQNELINKGSVTLAFMNAQTRRPSRPPAKLIEVMQPHF